MGWITNVSFIADVNVNDTLIPAGSRTQIRWDFGIGQINIGPGGKIIYSLHMYPLNDQAAEEYAKELETFTGVIETNMCVLFFKDGYIVDLDLSSACDNIIKDQESFYNIDDRHLCHSITNEEWELFAAKLLAVRELLASPVEEGEDSSTTVLRIKYNDRKKVLLDPFQEEELKARVGTTIMKEFPDIPRVYGKEFYTPTFQPLILKKE